MVVEVGGGRSGWCRWVVYDKLDVKKKRREKIVGTR